MKILALFKILIQAPLAVKATLAVATITTLSFAAFPEVPQFINNVMPNSFRHLNTKILKQAFEAVSPQAESVQDDILGVQDDKRNQGDDKGKQTGDRREGAVLAESTTANPGRLDINIPAFFNDPVSFNSASIFSGGLKVEGSSQLNLLTVNGAATFNENLTAPNVIYSLLAGTGIGITSGQTPTITNTGVTSLQGSTGALTFTAGSGMTISGLTITNNDKGTDQKIFKTISDGSTTFSAGSNTDTLTFAAGSGLSLSIDTSNKKVTFSSGSGGTAWTLNSTSLYPSSTTYNVGIGTTSPSYKLDVTGTGRYTSQLLLTGVPSSSASGGGSIYINPASATADYTLFGVSVGGTEKLRIDAEGDIHIQGSIISTTPGTVGYWSRVSTNTYLGNSGDLVGIGTSAPAAGIEVVRNGAASLSGGLFSGTWYTGGTSTTTKPQLLVEPTGTTSTAWSTSGTGLGVNAASGFSGNFIDLQVAGSTRFNVNSRGNLQVYDNATAVFFAGAGGITLNAGNAALQAGYTQVSTILGPGYATWYALRPTISLGGNTTTGGAESSASERFALNVAPGTLTITSGFATQRFDQFAQPTITAASALNISSEASTMNIAGAPISAGSATIANAYALKIATGTSVASGVTNAYGLFVDAPTGATNNYAAVFNTGNVGIGTTAPGAKLEVAGGGIIFPDSSSISVRQSGGVTAVINGISGTNYVGIPGGIYAQTSSGTNFVTWYPSGVAGGGMSFSGTATNTSINLAPSGTGSVNVNSAVSTGTTTSSGFVVNANSLNSGTGAYFTSSTLTTGKLVDISNTSNTQTTGTMFNISSTATSLTTGSLASLDWSPGSVQTTAATGNLFNINIGSNASNFAGNLFNVGDAGSSIFSISKSAVTTSLPVSMTAPGDMSIAYDINMTNPTASFVKSLSALTLQAGEVYGSADLTLKTYNQGSVVVDSAVTTGTAIDIQNTTLTTGYGLSFTGPSSTGITGSALYAISDIGSAGKLVNLAPDFSGSAVTGYGIYNAGTDSTAAANTNYGYYGSLTLTGNAAKNGYGIYQTVTSSSTTADTLYAANLATSVTGIMTTGTRNVYGLYANPSAGAESTGGTTNVYGGYFKADADVAAGGTVNGYGLYIANGAFDTDGTSTQYGLYVAEPTGADTNYSIYSAGGVNYFGGNVGIGTTAPTRALEIAAVNGNSDLKLGGYIYMAAGQLVGNSGADYIQFNSNDNTVHSNQQITNRVYANNGVIRFLIGNAYPEIMRITAGGNVGIGTTAPVAGLENASAGAASKPAGLLSGTWFTGGTSTTTKPQLLIEPTGTTSTAWSTAGTGLGVNAATGFAGNFLDFQMNGSSRTKINYRGNLTVTDLGTEVLFAGAGGVRISAGAFIPNVAIYRDGYAALEMYRPYIRLGAGAQSSGSELYAANVDPGTLTITSGFATQRFTQFIQPTITAASALNISSEATTLSISGAPISAGSATIANAYGIKVDSGTSVAAGVTNAYGLAVAAPTGATNNYAAIFTGGNVGIGTTAPSALLDIAASGTSYFKFSTANGITGTMITGTNTGNWLNVPSGLAPGSSYGGLGTTDGDFYINTNTSYKIVILGGTGAQAPGELDVRRPIHINPATSTAGSTSKYTLKLTGAAHTALPASTEQPDIDANFARTVTFATGALTNQRAVKIQAPTYAFAGASTLTNAATLYVDAAPTAGTNATITNAYSLWVDAGNSRFDGNITLATSGSSGGIIFSEDDKRIYYTGETGGADANLITFRTGGTCCAAIETGAIRIAGTLTSAGVGIPVSTGTWSVTNDGAWTLSPTTSANATTLTLTGAAYTNQTASTELSDVNFNLARTVQFATGALTTQRAVQISAPTYGFVGASTLTNASTFAISGAPVAGTNATVTNAYALNIAAGAVGAGTTNAYGLYVAAPTGATNNYAAIFTGGNVGIGTTAPSAPFEVKATGTGTIAKFTSTNTTGCTLADGGTISCSSDRRLKKNIESLPYGLDTIMALNAVEYHWNTQSDSTVKSIGFIAQEVETVVPNLVITDPSNGQKQLNTIGLVPVLAKALQELNHRVNNLTLSPSSQPSPIKGEGDNTIPSPLAGEGQVFDSEGLSPQAQTRRGEGDAEATLSAKLATLESKINNLEASLSAVLANNVILSDNEGSLADASSSAETSSEILRSAQNDTSWSDLIAQAATASANLSTPSPLTGEGWGEGDLTISNTLKSLGKTYLGDTTIAGNFSVDGTMSISGSSINSLATSLTCHPEQHTLPSGADSGSNIDSGSKSGMTDNCEDTLGILYIQDSPLASVVDFFNGQVKVTKEGTISAQKLELSDKATGTATMKDDTNEVWIETTAITEDSKVLVTALEDTATPLYVTDKIPGQGFNVKIRNKVTQDIEFDWLIIDSK